MRLSAIGLGGVLVLALASKVFYVAEHDLWDPVWRGLMPTLAEELGASPEEILRYPDGGTVLPSTRYVVWISPTEEQLEIEIEALLESIDFAGADAQLTDRFAIVISVDGTAYRGIDDSRVFTLTSRLGQWMTEGEVGGSWADLDWVAIHLPEDLIREPLRVSSTEEISEDARTRAYVAAMKSDLKNLASQQEIYYSDEYSYTSSVSALAFTPSDGVTVNITPLPQEAAVPTEPARSVEAPIEPASSFCEKCGAALGSEAAFCKGCGAQIALSSSPSPSGGSADGGR